MPEREALGRHASGVGEGLRASVVMTAASPVRSRCELYLVFIRSAHLFEGVRLEREVVLEPFTVRPVSLDRGYFGRDARVAFNAELADSGAVTVVDAPSWGVQFGPYHRMAFAVSAEFAFADTRGLFSLNAAAAQLAGPLALAYGGVPRLLASITEARATREDEWRTAAITAGGGDPQTGALLQVQTAGHPIEEIAPEAIWTRASKDRRLTFWLTLFRDVLAESRWDVRVFRVCSLLETIGGESSRRTRPSRMRRVSTFCSRLGLAPRRTNFEGGFTRSYGRALTSSMSQWRCCKRTLTWTCGMRSESGPTSATSSRTTAGGRANLRGPAVSESTKRSRSLAAGVTQWAAGGTAGRPRRPLTWSCVPPRQERSTDTTGWIHRPPPEREDLSASPQSAIRAAWRSSYGTLAGRRLAQGTVIGRAWIRGPGSAGRAVLILIDGRPVAPGELGLVGAGAAFPVGFARHRTAGVLARSVPVVRHRGDVCMPMTSLSIRETADVLGTTPEYVRMLLGREQLTVVYAGRSRCVEIGSVRRLAATSPVATWRLERMLEPPRRP